MSGDAGPGEVGLTLHRSLGIPYMTAPMVRFIMRVAADQNDEQAWPSEIDKASARRHLKHEMYGPSEAEADEGGGVLVFDALPVKVPAVERRKSDLRWIVANGLHPEEPPIDRHRASPSPGALR